MAFRNVVAIKVKKLAGQVNPREETPVGYDFLGPDLRGGMLFDNVKFREVYTTSIGRRIPGSINESLKFREFFMVGSFRLISGTINESIPRLAESFLTVVRKIHYTTIGEYLHVPLELLEGFLRTFIDEDTPPVQEDFTLTTVRSVDQLDLIAFGEAYETNTDLATELADDLKISDALTGERLEYVEPVDPSIFIEDFENTTVTQNSPSGFTREGELGGIVSVVSDRVYGNGKALKIVTSVVAEARHRFFKLNTFSNLLNFETLIRGQIIGNSTNDILCSIGQYVSINDHYITDVYRLLNNDVGCEILKYVNEVLSQSSSFSAGITSPPGGFFYSRSRFDETAIKVKVWLAGTPEPAGWTGEIVRTNPVRGAVGFTAFFNDTTMYVEGFSVVDLEQNPTGSAPMV